MVKDIDKGKNLSTLVVWQALFYVFYIKFPPLSNPIKTSTQRIGRDSGNAFQHSAIDVSVA